MNINQPKMNIDYTMTPENNPAIGPVVVIVQRLNGDNHYYTMRMDAPSFLTAIGTSIELQRSWKAGEMTAYRIGIFYVKAKRSEVLYSHSENLELIASVAIGQVARQVHRYLFEAEESIEFPKISLN